MTIDAIEDLEKGDQFSIAEKPFNGALMEVTASDATSIGVGSVVAHTAVCGCTLYVITGVAGSEWTEVTNDETDEEWEVHIDRYQREGDVEKQRV